MIVLEPFKDLINLLDLDMNIGDVLFVLAQFVSSILGWIFKIVDTDCVAEDLALNVLWLFGQEIDFFQNFI